MLYLLMVRNDGGGDALKLLNLLGRLSENFYIENHSKHNSIH